MKQEQSRRNRVALSMLIPLLLPTLALGAALELTHGVSIGDVTSDSAIVWGRCSGTATLVVEAKAKGGKSTKTGKVRTTDKTDFTGQVTLTSLKADQLYEVTVACTDAQGARGKAEVASFRSAPKRNQSRPISFIVGADLGGQTYCRLKDGGYPIFKPMTALKADFFIANGDMIYADDHCPEVNILEPGKGRVYIPGDFPNIAARGIDWTNSAELDRIYRDHWKYNRADPAFQEFLRSTPQYVQWDDHEVVNDFGASWPLNPHSPERPGYSTLVERGLQSLFDYHPMTIHPKEPKRIYRSFRWGRDLELFIIDARSYRDRNDKPDELDENGQFKTMLGQEQLDWLLKGLRDSDATWKLVSSNVPLSIPTGSHPDAFGHDAFANGQHFFWEDPIFSHRTGFEKELLYLLRELDRADVRNLVVVATDVHFASHLRLERDFDGDGDTLRFFELVSGPLSAGRREAPPEFDPTLKPVVLYAEGGFFNFSYVRIDSADGRSRIIADVRDETGRVRPGSELEIRPE